MHLLRVVQVGLGELLLVQPFPIPNRDPVAPPQLAADAPVLDVLQPVQVHLAPALGEERDEPVADHGLRLFDPRVPQPPLPREPRLDRDVRALRITDVVGVRLLGEQRSPLLEQLGRLLPAREPIQARELRTGEFVQPAVRLEHVDDRELVPRADLEIHLVVRRRDLERTGAEFLVHRAVPDDRNLRRGPQRPAHRPANPAGVPRVVRMHGDRHVTRDRLGPGRLHLDELARRVSALVADTVHRPVHRLHDDLLVAQGGLRHRAPVHHPLAAVDVSLPKQIHEYAEHRPRIMRIHRELRPLPVARGTEPAQLLEDDPALLVPPLPHLVQELLAAEIMSRLLLLAQLPLHHRLGGDTGVVGAGQPER